jgi:hypothetical protein
MLEIARNVVGVAGLAMVCLAYALVRRHTAAWRRLW